MTRPTGRADLAEAQRLYDKALRRERAGRTAEAARLYRKALTHAPGEPHVLNNLGACLAALGRSREALAAFRRAEQAKPGDPVAPANVAGELLAQGDWAGAAEAAERALAADPAYPPALLAAARAAEHLQDLAASERYLERAAEARPDLAPAQRGLARIRYMRDDHAGALEAIEAALDLAPGEIADNAFAYHVSRFLCRWDRLEALDRALDAAFAATPAPEDAGRPFRYLARAADPALQLRVGRIEAARVRRMAGLRKPAAPAAAKRRDGRFRIGYVSADFRDHPAMKLLAGVFRRHDRARFAVHAYALGADDGDQRRAELREGSERFHELSGASAAEIAEAIRGDRLDLVVDLMGWSRNSRPEALALRPAPVQAAWLGFPGTTGADFIDYVIADRVVAPPEELAHFSEAPAWTPASYYPFDDATPPPPAGAERSEHGLPAEGAVFCSFNQSFKFDPERFATWARILGRVPGSTLWLLSCGEAPERRLRDALAGHGVAPERLVFAPRAPHEAHLARHAAADLMLDTWLYNGHTTSIDALASGVPVVTRIGPTFAARVSASLLGAAGMEDLVTSSEAAYEDLAVAIATDPERLAELKARTRRARAESPLFDTARFTRDLEALYVRMIERSRAGETPAPLSLS